MTHSCIYCGSKGPFNDEHVISASIGGDDPGWLLRDCVCIVCNTQVFSPLEAKFSRRSIITIPRLSLQPTSRKRGGKTEAPVAQPNHSLFVDHGTGVVAEVNMLAGLIPDYLPQIHVAPHGQRIELRPVGPADHERMRSFLTVLAAALSDRVEIVEKKEEGGFRAHSLVLQGSSYIPVSVTEQAKPPKSAIWFAPLEPVRSMSPSEIPATPRVFLHSSGSITCRADRIDLAGKVLGIIRTELHELTVVGDEAPQSAGQPLIRQNYTFNMVDFARVLTKTAMNVIAHQAGDKLARIDAFAHARSFARLGEPLVSLNASDGHAIPEPLQTLGDDHHTIGIFDAREPASAAALFKLYGGAPYEIQLSDTALLQLGIAPIWLSVDYTNHKVTRLL